jgi:rhamnosyl/mannosyltransferase
LHLHLPNPSAFWALALPSARRIPWIVHWHADVITARQGWAMKLAYALYRPLERSVLKRAAAIVATSEPYRDSSEPLQPWLSKCRVVPLGMAAGRLDRRAPRDLPEDDHIQPLRVLFVGRLTYYKGLRYLIEAASKFEGMLLELVGDGDQKTALTQLVASLDLESRVTLHGSIPDDQLAELLGDCDCLCLPSIERTEAFGMVLLEAMRFGKAAVVSDVHGSGMGWIVEHEVTGLKVEPANPGLLADAFRRLADDRALCRIMGDRGRKKFDRLFEINQTAGGIINIYSEVLRRTKQATH